MPRSIVKSIKPSPVRDVYRFGNGPEIVLQPGTMGWSAAEMEDPVLRRLWDQGRYEIIDGMLIVMPAAVFIGGESAATLIYLLRSYFRSLQIPAAFSSEVDVQINDTHLLRADAVAVVGDDLGKFKALKFPKPETDWRKHALIIPPTLIIESISEGHEAHDRQSKRKWYAEFGVRHYWIVDSYKKSLECLLLKDGQYIDEASGIGMDSVAPASFPGLSISLAEVWGD